MNENQKTISCWCAFACYVHRVPFTFPVFVNCVYLCLFSVFRTTKKFHRTQYERSGGFRTIFVCFIVYQRTPKFSQCIGRILLNYHPHQTNNKEKKKIFFVDHLMISLYLTSSVLPNSMSHIIGVMLFLTNESEKEKYSKEDDIYINLFQFFFCISRARAETHKPTGYNRNVYSFIEERSISLV